MKYFVHSRNFNGLGWTSNISELKLYWTQAPLAACKIIEVYVYKHASVKLHNYLVIVVLTFTIWSNSIPLPRTCARADTCSHCVPS